MEAPRGVDVSAAQGQLKVSSRKDIQLESTDGEVRDGELENDLSSHYILSSSFIFHSFSSLVANIACFYMVVN